MLCKGNNEEGLKYNKANFGPNSTYDNKLVLELGISHFKILGARATV